MKNLKDLEPHVLDKKAFKSFLEIGFPTKKVEEYKYLDLTFLNDRDLKPIDSNLNLDSNLDSLKPYLFNEKDFYNLVFINGKFHESISNVPNSIKISKILNRSTTSHSLRNLNLSFNIERLKFHFTQNLDKPIAFVHINSCENLDSRSVFTNNEISLDKNVKIQMIDKFVNHKQNDLLNNNIFDIRLDSNSYLDHYIIEKSENLQFNHYKIEIDDFAKYKGFLINTKSKISRFDFEINLNKTEAAAEINGIYIAENTQTLDHYIKTNHKSKKTYSSHYLKGIIKDRAKGIFYASTIAEKNAQKIEAKQLNKNLLLDKTAKSFSKPELWIKADDVKCSHGSTTGQLDKEALFYLQSRGFEKKDARELLLKAFIEEIIEKIDQKDIKKHIKDKIL
ncbi:MAG: FeS cluster assembly protein SufD [Candidatus Anoxychlamydiales bacterium]|nr:FeS cluster assembly protein SufD [Candidatus Anoxychlamydiales bacterium]